MMFRVTHYVNRIASVLEPQQREQLAAVINRLRGYLPVAILIYWGILLAGIYLFIELAEEVYEREGFWFDEVILTFFGTHQSDILNHFFRAATWAGSLYALGPISLVIIIALLRLRHGVEAILIFVGVSGAALITHASKYILARNRPELFPALIPPPTNYAFPSGHATQIAAFAVSVFLIIHRIKPDWQPPFAVLASVLILAVSLSRVYLQVHYPSDVIGGILVGAIWSLGAHAFLAWRQRGWFNNQSDR